MTRHVYEGRWRGYSSNQDRVVYREVLTTKKQVARRQELSSIIFTDGTALEMSLREATPREKVTPITGYRSLVSDALWVGGSVVTVAAINEKKSASKAA